MVTKQTINIEQIALDGMNVRHALQKIDSEADIIAFLIKTERIYEMAEHISLHGMNPLEDTAVVAEDGKYKVLEGNRRLCALKLLNDPALATSEYQKNKYKDLVDNSKRPVPRFLECLVFDSRDEARPWIELKHTRGQKAGIRPWSPDAQAKYYAHSKNRLAEQLKTYGKEMRFLSEEQIDSIPLTTLTRYLSNPSVRDTLGIVSSSDLLVNKDKSDFEKVAKVFLTDAFERKLSSRSNASQREKYAFELKKRVPTSNIELSITINLVPQNWVPKDTGQDDKPKPRARLISGHWKGLDYLGEGNKDKIIRRIVDELKEINIDKFSFATACLVRILMECSFKRYLGKSASQATTLKKLYEMTDEQLQKKTEKGFTKALTKAHSNKGHYLHPNMHGGLVHGSMAPTRKELEDMWNDIEPIIVKTLELGKKQ